MATGELSNPLLTPYLIRLVVAGILGGAIGYEREKDGKSAGVRTQMLICMGCALFVMIPAAAEMGEDAFSRIAQGIAGGIGFLGAGAILKLNQREEIHGLTTAASIWLTAAVGTAVGAGLVYLAAVSVLFAWVILSVIRYWEVKMKGIKFESTLRKSA